MAKGRKLKIFSFFAGCGILDLGFEKAGYDIEFVNEFFKPFQDAYIYSIKMMKIRSSPGSLIRDMPKSTEARYDLRCSISPMTPNRAF